MSVQCSMTSYRYRCCAYNAVRIRSGLCSMGLFGVVDYTVRSEAGSAFQTSQNKPITHMVYVHAFRDGHPPRRHPHAVSYAIAHSQPPKRDVKTFRPVALPLRSQLSMPRKSRLPPYLPYQSHHVPRANNPVFIYW
jgi:hypothetical protein